MNLIHLLLGAVAWIPFVSCTSVERYSGDRAITRVIISENHDPRHDGDPGLVSGERAVIKDVISVTPSGLPKRQ